MSNAHETTVTLDPDPAAQIAEMASRVETLEHEPSETEGILHDLRGEIAALTKRVVELETGQAKLNSHIRRIGL